MRYRQGWRALNRLLHEDRSFSGGERNCAFLNTGGDSASFADVSAVTGFGFADDGRGLATADWDFDGDLDIWTTNRTAPRVRFLKNNTPDTNKRFIAFKLRGDGIGTNRDAIGARLELHLTGSNHPLRIRTLRCGEGFLSQSSNWIHFGIGQADSIEKLVVRWPGGSSEEISGSAFGKFYLIRQGSGSAKEFTPPAKRQPLAASPQTPTPISENVRLIVPPGLILPQLTTLAADGSETQLELETGSPKVINIWASWCAPCIAELAEWTNSQEKLKAAGFEIIALGTDAINSTSTAALAATNSTISKTGFPFRTAQISEGSLRSLDYLQRSVLDRWKPLPVPTTFLVEPNGEILAIYKGTIHASQLISDLQLAEATPGQRRDAAIPFPGRWVDEKNHHRSDPKRVSSMMLDHNQTTSAISYLDRSAERLVDQKKLPNYAQELGDIYFTSSLLKSITPTHSAQTIPTLTKARDLLPDDLRIRKELAKHLHAAGKINAAASEMLEAARIAPDDMSIKGDIVNLYQQLGEYAKMLPILEQVLKKDPENSLALHYLAGVQLKLGQPKQAITNYRKVLSNAPRMLDAANNLAWTLATHPDESIRSDDEALALALRLVQITKEKQPQFLGTLAAAHANKGNFEKAIEAATKAIAIDPDNSSALRSKLAQYKIGKPHRE